MSLPSQLAYPLTALLERAGATIRQHGRRADCPACKGRRTISLTDELFFCHRCGFKGNARSLAKSLGLSRSLTWPEVQALRRRQFQEKWAARQVRGGWLTLVEEYRQVMRIINGATRRGWTEPENEIVWRALDFAYRHLDQVRAQLAVLENRSAIEAAAFLQSQPEIKARRMAEVIRAGGITDTTGKFRDVEFQIPGAAR